MWAPRCCRMGIAPLHLAAPGVAWLCAVGAVGGPQERPGVDAHLAQRHPGGGGGGVGDPLRHALLHPAVKVRAVQPWPLQPAAAHMHTCMHAPCAAASAGRPVCLPPMLCCMHACIDILPCYAWRQPCCGSHAPLPTHLPTYPSTYPPALPFLRVRTWPWPWPCRRQYKVLLESLLPKELIHDLRMDTARYGAAATSAAPRVQLDTETPADKLLGMMSSLLKGQAPALPDIIMLRTTLLRSADIYQPINIAMQLRANSNVDVSQRQRAMGCDGMRWGGMHWGGVGWDAWSYGGAPSCVAVAGAAAGRQGPCGSHPLSCGTHGGRMRQPSPQCASLLAGEWLACGDCAAGSALPVWWRRRTPRICSLRSWGRSSARCQRWRGVRRSPRCGGRGMHCHARAGQGRARAACMHRRNGEGKLPVVAYMYLLHVACRMNAGRSIWLRLHWLQRRAGTWHVLACGHIGALRVM